jgi:hypothetical protein
MLIESNPRSNKTKTVLQISTTIPAPMQSTFDVFADLFGVGRFPFDVCACVEAGEKETFAGKRLSCVPIPLSCYSETGLFDMCSAASRLRT